MKKSLFIYLCVFCMTVMMSACGKETQTGNTESESQTGVVESESQTEDAESEVQKDEIIDADNVDYWLAKLKNPDEIILSVDKIQKQNQLMLETWGRDYVGGYYDIQSFSETVDRQWLIDRISYMDLRHTKLYDKGKAVADAQWDVYYKQTNLDAIPEKVKLRYGVITNNTPAFDLPTEDILTSSKNGSSNALQQTSLKMNEPVVILWNSADENWYYIAANEYIGWIKAEDCAWFASYKDGQWVSDREAWVEFQNQQEFLMVCEDNERFLMGTKLFIENVLEFSGGKQYIVRTPMRGDEGTVLYQYTTVSTEVEKLSEGYLPYTRANVLKLAFQELGEPYGWGGLDGKRDCSSYIKDIYNCFGFRMPRNSRIQMSIPVIAKNTSAMSEAEKEKSMQEAQPGAVLGINGHVMLYIGSANNQHYVISMLGSYIPETVTEDFGSHIETVNKVMVNTLDVKRKNGNTWLQELLAIIELK